MTALGAIFPTHFPAAQRKPRVSTSAASDGLRLRRRDPVVPDGFVDGGWWPRSLDLCVELPQLLAALWSAGHEVARVVYNPAAWDPAPRALIAAGRLVTLDRNRGREPAMLTLIDTRGVTHTELVVIPPRTDHRVAERILALVQHGGDLRRVVGILDRAGREQSAVLEHASSLDPLPTSVWETDGGRILAP